MQIVYYESAIKNHPRTRQILQKTGRGAVLIECDNYQEIFNLKSQNFRLQKRRPALILANKTGKLVIPTPESFGIGGHENYYFSHMLNCLYDCRYCFLQGMYPSAHYVVFINYEDFADEITKIISASPERTIYFFSGYDCDSLAFDEVTNFLEFFLAFFSRHPRAFLELRTKSAHVQPLLAQPAIANCVVAFSFTPEAISSQVEHKVPPLKKRLLAMSQLARAGWRIGLRFDPLINAENFEEIYRELIFQIFQHIPPESVHSVSIGPLRFPQKMYQKIIKLYPSDKLMAQPLLKREQHYSYSPALEQRMKTIVETHLQKYISSNLFFACNAL